MGITIGDNNDIYKSKFVNKKKKNIINLTQNIDYVSLIKETEILKNHFCKEKSNDKNDILIRELTQLKTALEKREDNKVITIIKKIGTEIYDITKRVGCSIIARVISENLM